MQMDFPLAMFLCLYSIKSIKKTKNFLRTSISFIIHTILAKGNNKIWTTRNKLTLVPHATQPWPRPRTGQNWITKTNSRLFCKENIGQTILKLCRKCRGSATSSCTRGWCPGPAWGRTSASPACTPGWSWTSPSSRGWRKIFPCPFHPYFLPVPSCCCPPRST